MKTIWQRYFDKVSEDSISADEYYDAVQRTIAHYSVDQDAMIAYAAASYQAKKAVMLGLVHMETENDYEQSK